MPGKPLSLLKIIAVYAGFTALFIVLLFTLMPFLKANFSINPALYWFITGYFLFIPFFVFSIAAVRKEGNINKKDLFCSLNIRKFSKRDWVYSVVGLLLVFGFTGIIFGISGILNRYFGIRPLSTTPWFMDMRPFQGAERLLLLVWLPMFFCNIAGEELLWRGYLQTRMKNKKAWPLCSILWMFFHIPFGPDLMIMLIPIIIIIPYVYSKTSNTLTGIFIHGIYNGPIFIAVALGAMN